LRILLVVNSFASSVTARNTVVVQRRLSHGNDVEVVETNRRGHATRFAHDAARRGIDVVIGYGGDGTLNEVATGIAGTDTALGVLPGGSTNVFARTLGSPLTCGRWRPIRPRRISSSSTRSRARA
jgi:diacylglycerol kinase family enzyme